jgi:hypothetical protein
MGYAICLALISMVLEMIARYAQRRSLNFNTTGFVYHPERDIWQCPRDQHLFPIFSGEKHTVYRAPASACNACPSKAACTDSSHGREIRHVKEVGLEFGMNRFHRAISITLLTLASILIVIDFALCSSRSVRRSGRYLARLFRSAAIFRGKLCALTTACSFT